MVTSAAGLEICDRLDLDLAGIPDTSFEIPLRYQDLPHVGTPMSPDLEILASMHPTCIISPSTLIDDLQPKYASINAPCIFLDLSSVAGMYESIAYLAEKFDRIEQSDVMQAEYANTVQAFQARIAGYESPRVLVLMGVPGSYLVATENSYVGSLVGLAGGENIYAGTDKEFLNVNTEDMQARDPDIILRAAHTLPDEIQKMFAEEFETNDIWKHFRAVQEGEVYDLSYGNFGMSANFSYPQALDELYEDLYGSDEGAANETA